MRTGVTDPDRLALAWHDVEAAAGAHSAALDEAAKAATVTAISRLRAAAEGPGSVAPTPLTHEVSGGASHCVVTFTGDVDLSTAGVLHEVVRARLEQPDTRVVQLDLRGISFLDSSGLRVLVELRASATTLDTTLALVGAPPTACAARSSSPTSTSCSSTPEHVGPCLRATWVVRSRFCLGRFTARSRSVGVAPAGSVGGSSRDEGPARRGRAALLRPTVTADAGPHTEGEEL